MNTSAVMWVENLRESGTLEPVDRALKALLGDAPTVEMVGAEVRGERSSVIPEVVISWSRSDNVAVDLLRRGYKHQHRFAVIPSRSRPRWLLPQRPGSGGVDGFEVYTPFSSGAKLMKTLLTGIRATGWQGWARHSVLIASKRPTAFETLAQKVTGEKQLAFAFSLGTPGLFQKLTIQVMAADGRILGYAKLPLTDAASKRLEHEARILNSLQGFPSLRSRIPQLLYGGTWNDGYVLIQTVLPGRPGPTRFSPLHSEFLKALHDCNPSMLPGRSVVREVRREWGKVASQMGSGLQCLGRDALHIAARDLDAAQVLCGISHGDFAPWNARLYRDSLFLFDWESARMDAPCAWDQFHFLAQTESLLGMKQPARGLTDARTRNRSLYLLYLLHSTSRLLEERAEEKTVLYREQELARWVSDSSTAAAD